jgi:hypothetical protein
MLKGFPFQRGLRGELKSNTELPQIFVALQMRLILKLRYNLSLEQCLFCYSTAS